MGMRMAIGMQMDTIAYGSQGSIMVLAGMASWLP